MSQSNAKEDEVEQLWRLTKLYRANIKKDVLFIIGDWNAKVEIQEISRVTGKFGLGVQNEAGQSLKEFCQENTLVIANTHFQLHKRQLYTWTSTDDQYQHQTDYTLCSQIWRSSLQSAKIRHRADYGSGHELLIVKCRHKLKKVVKTSRSFRYDINQISYYYTGEVMSRFKGLDWVDRVPEDLRKDVHSIIPEAVTKINPRKRNARRWNSCMRRFNKYLRKKEKWKAREKGKDIHPTEFRAPDINKER